MQKFAYVQQGAFFFFCGQAAGNDGLHEVTTFQVGQRVRECAELTGDSMLLARLISGDMVVAVEAKYHSKCLLALYHHARKGAGTARSSIAKRTKYQELFLLNL